ncbi:MAG: T9SS type A sorting domain-containing protein [Balneolales bacterium]
MLFFKVFIAGTLFAYQSGELKQPPSEITDDNELIIWAPRQHNPEFVEPGGVFLVELKGASDLSVDGWSVSVNNDLKSWPAIVETAEWGLIHLETEEGWKLRVKIPEDISPELMELRINHISGLTATRKRSVSIVPDFETNFYILQQSDQHITNTNAVTAGGKASKEYGNGSMEAMQWITESVNLANPRFILNTGDNSHVYNSQNSWGGIEKASERVARFLEGLSGLTVPSVVTPGNHDTGWSEYISFDEWRARYKKEFGQTAFSFRMGSFYVVNSEWPLNEFYDWTLDDFNKAGANPEIKYRLIITHHFNGIDAGTTISRQENPADLLLQGHRHNTLVVRTEPYPVLSVHTAQDYQRAAFFDFNRSEDGWASPQIATHANEVNVHRMVGDWGDSKLWAEYKNDNNGTVNWNIVDIKNTLPHNFYDGRIRFLMANNDKYTVDGGQVISQYEYDDGQKLAILVKVNIPNNGITQVSVNGVNTSVEPESLPDEFFLDQNYPNPFNPSTRIEFSIPVASHVKLNVYTLTGQLVQTLVDGFRQEGRHLAVFDAVNLTSGVYLYKLEAGNYRQVKQMTLIK